MLRRRVLDKMEKKQVFEYLKNNEFDIQSAKAAYLLAGLVYNSYVKYKMSNGKYFSPMFCYFCYKKSSLFSQVLNKTMINEVSKCFFEDYLKDNSNFPKMLTNMEDLYKKMSSLWNKYNNKRPNVSKEDTLLFLEELFNHFRILWKNALISEDKAEIINLEIVPRFQKRNNLSQKEAEEIVHALSYPDTKSVFTQERSDFLKICLFVLNDKKLSSLILRKDFDEVLKDKKLKKLVDDYITIYYWIKTDYYSAIEITPLVLLRDVFNEVNENNADFIKKEIKKFDLGFKEITAKKKKILSKCKLSNADRIDIEFAKFAASWMDIRKEQYMKGFYFVLVTLNDISRLLNMDYTTLSFYSIEELLNLLKNNKKVSNLEIENRKKGTFIVFTTEKSTNIHGPDAKKMIDTVTSFKAKNEIFGNVGCKTKDRFVEGIVNVILDPNNEKFESGKILVTSMTRVEFVPLMRKAKAIITDEGGIACHAAIVSRELGIPCIIATKHATKILKTGDKVRMDTEKGVVKKIK